MTRVFHGLDDLNQAVGQEVGKGSWLHIDQDRIDAFAEATGDHQWIHVDPQRAAAGPFGSTIAHGYLTLSLLPALAGGLVEYAGWPIKVNYGCDKVRFPMPVRVGSRVRAVAVLAAVRTTAAGVLVTTRVTVEVDDAEGQPGAKPALVADTLTLLVSPS